MNFSAFCSLSVWGLVSILWLHLQLIKTRVSVSFGRIKEKRIKKDQPGHTRRDKSRAKELEKGVKSALCTFVRNDFPLT